MEEGDFNKFLKDHFSGKIDKRKKNEFTKLLETCKLLLQTEINQTRNFESLFQEENWKILLAALEGFDLSKNEELQKVSLELLQLFSVITPKGKRN